MLISDWVKIKWHNSNKKHFISKGYYFTKIGDEFLVKVNDLNNGSHINVLVICDYCYVILNKEFRAYLNQNKNAIIHKDCCENCRTKKTIESNLIVYGKENVFQVEEIREKHKSNMLLKYNCEYPSQIEDNYEKIKNTSLLKYGTEHPMQNEDVKKKILNTNRERYGCDSYTQTKEYITKTINTNRRKYGCENPMQNEEIKTKQKQTNLNNIILKLKNIKIKLKLHL